MEPYYLKRHGSFARQIIIPLNQKEIKVGRKDTPELQDGLKVSRRHAVFERSSKGLWYVKDLGSTNGVFLNSIPIGSGLYAINVGDVIGLGATNGESDEDYVFIVCNNRTLSLNNRSSTADENKNHHAESGCLVTNSSASKCGESSHGISHPRAGSSTAADDELVYSERNGLPVYNTNHISDNFSGVRIKKEVVNEELEKSINSNGTKTSLGNLPSTANENKNHRAESSCLVTNSSASKHGESSHSISHPCARSSTAADYELVHSERNVLPVYNTNHISDNFLGVRIKKEVADEELEKSINSNGTKTSLDNCPLTADKNKNHPAESSCLVTNSSASKCGKSSRSISHPRVGSNTVMDHELSHSERNGLPVFNTNSVLGNFSGMWIKKEIVDEELGKSISSNGTKTVNHVIIKKERPESPVDSNLCSKGLSSVNGNVSDVPVPPLLVDSRNYVNKNSLADTAKRKGDSSVPIPYSNIKNSEHKNVLKVQNTSLEPSSSAISVKTVPERGKKLCSSPSTSLRNGNCKAKHFPALKDLKVVLTKYDDIVVETYRIERNNDENDSGSSCSDKIIPHKRCGSRLRINSSSSDDSEKAHTYQSNGSRTCTIDEKPHKVSTEDSRVERCEGGDCNAPMSPEVKSCATVNITFPLNTEEDSNQCYSQEDEIIVSRIKRNSDENDSGSLCSDEIIPHKRCGRRLRINSSSSDDSEKAHTFQSNGSRTCTVDEKPHEVSTEDTRVERCEGGDCNAPMSPEVKSCATVNITFALNTDEDSNQCYSQEDEIIVISSDDEYDYAKNPLPVKIKTEPVDNDDLSNSEWQYVSNSQDICEHEAEDEVLSDSETRNVSESVPCRNSVPSSASETNLVTKHQKHQMLREDVNDEKASENLQWEHTAEPDDSPDEELFNASENIENITKFLCDTAGKSVPVISFNGSKSGRTTSKTEENDFFPPLTQSLLSDELEKPDSTPCSHHTELPDKSQKPFSRNKEIPISGNSQKTLHDQVKESSRSSRTVEFHTSLSSKPKPGLFSEFQKESSKNCDRSVISAVHRPLSPEGQRKKTSAKRGTEAALNDFCKRVKEKTFSKTVLTEAMPMQFRSRYKRGREEWFADQYENDRQTENKEVSKEEKVQKGVKGSSKNKAHASATRHKNSKPKSNGTVTKHKKGKSSSLRDQMQNRYLTIPHRSKAAPAIRPSCNKQTYESGKHEKNFSYPVKRKSTAPPDDTSAIPIKERKVIAKRKERFNSRMAFLTENVAADDAVASNVDCLRKKSSIFLTEKSSGNIISSALGNKKSDEVSNQKGSPTEEPSALKKSQVPKHGNAPASSHIHSENSSVPGHSNPQIQTVARQCVPTRNSSATQISDHHHQTTSRSVAPARNLLDSHFKIPKSRVVTTNSSVSGSSTVQTQLTSVSCIPPASNMSTSQTADPRLLAKIPSISPPISHVPGPTLQVKVTTAVPISCLSTTQAPNPAIQGSIPSANSSTSVPADPRFQAKVPPSSLPDAQISDPRLHVNSLNRPYNTFYHNSTKNAATFGSSTQAPNVGIVVPRKVSQPEPSAKLPIKLSSESFILHILSWNPPWLRVQQSRNVPPPVVDWKKVQPLKLFYQSFDDYALSFYNLLLVEMWESLFQAWKETKPDRDFTFVVTNYFESSDLLILDCESLLSKTMSHYPIEGTLLIIDLRVAEHKVLKLFAYTSHCKFHSLSEIAELHTELKKLPEASEQNPQYCKFKLKTKKKDLTICLNKRMKGCVLNYISVSQRIINSLVSLQSSPLVKDILCPQEKDCTISSTVHPNKEMLRRYNKAQASAIIGISDEMRKVYSVPRILLLQGPPGTGKTHVIIGIIENLLSKKDGKIKILVTAPSNAAADEIGRRLITLRRCWKSAETKALNFVRIGIPNQIHREVQPFSLDSLVNTSLKKKWGKQINTTKSSLSKINAKIHNIKGEINSLRSKNVPQQNITVVERELSMQERRAKLCVQDINNLENKTVKRSDPAVYQLKLTLLKNADVILSTLSSCRQSIVESSFGKKSDVHFTCCIVDEASQCTEPEALQPLAYGMCKLLLVGDHQQLPATVRSRIAVENHLERSLFERIHSYFDSCLGRSPVYMLTEQYRMHSEICAFPSAHFYSHLLKTPREVDLKYDLFPLKPYFFLNVAYSKESNAQTSKTNVLEAEIIIPLCIALVKICPQDCTIGVITPYQGQKKIYEAAFSRHASCHKIEVNTVDSFQGREKDLIIISCVRAHSQDGSIGFLSSKKRLNVAITRAAKCLIICGHTDSLIEKPLWGTLIKDATCRKLLIPVTAVDDIPFILEDMRKKMF